MNSRRDASQHSESSRTPFEPTDGWAAGADPKRVDLAIDPALEREITRTYADELGIPFVTVVPHIGVIAAGFAFGLLTTVENGLARLVGLAIGLPLSQVAARKVVALFDSDLLAMPFIWSWSIAFAAGIGVLAVLLLAQVPALRGMARLNLATALRARVLESPGSLSPPGCGGRATEASMFFRRKDNHHAADLRHQRRRQTHPRRRRRLPRSPKAPLGCFRRPAPA